MVQQPVGESGRHDADRLRFFTDAVVAIAMTLLILPLLETVSEAAAEDLTTAEFLREHQEQLLSFVISFVVIASFWMAHERLFSHVGAWSGLLVRVNVAWMLTIVFLPVATAMTGSLTTDALQIVVYVGTMWLTSVVMLLMTVVVRRDPRLWADGRQPGTVALAGVASLVVLFSAALVLALLLPTGAHYYAMFVLLLSGPLRHVLDRRLHR